MICGVSLVISTISSTLKTSVVVLSVLPDIIRGFREAVGDCGLVDIPLDGYQFSWFKSLGMPNAKEERLDRALVTSPQQSLFLLARLQNLVASISDHTPLLLTLNPSEQHSQDVFSCLRITGFLILILWR